MKKKSSKEQPAPSSKGPALKLTLNPAATAIRNRLRIEKKKSREATRLFESMGSAKY